MLTMTRLRRIDLDVLAVRGMWFAVVAGLAVLWAGVR